MSGAFGDETGFDQAGLGLAAPFSRPARTAVTAGAIMFGAVAVTFGVGLSTTLNRVYADLRLSDTAPLRMYPAPSGPVVAQPGQPKKVNGTGGPPSASPAGQRTIAAALVVVAGLGVLNTVVLQLRERVHDLGVFKSAGMTPRQAIAMVVCSVTLIGQLAGIVAVPLGVLVHNGVVPVMGHAASTDLPAAVISVYSWWQYVVLALAGLVIAIVAALGPASWAAGARERPLLRRLCRSPSGPARTVS